MKGSLRDLRDRLGGLRELRGPREVALFLYLSGFAALVPALMRLPLARVAALLARPPANPVRSRVDAARVVRMVEIAPRVARPFVRRGCLTRGVTLFWFLRRAGLDVELRFGLDFADGDDGHCWLTLDGEPYLEKVDPRARFAETLRLPVGVVP